MTTWTSLADFAARQTPHADAVPAWVHRSGAQTARVGRWIPGGRRALEEVIDTVVALQRAEWLEDGLVLGARVFPEAHRDLLACATTLDVAVPPAVVTDCGGARQAVLGTDAHPILHLSSGFLSGATPAERRFLLGRLLGPLCTDTVTLASLYALLVDHDGLRRLARRNLGPTFEIVLAPLSLGARVLLARQHRALEITADRAGLLCAQDLPAAERALARLALGVSVPSDDPLYDAPQRSSGSPGRWAELLSSRPWTHKRVQALRLFAGSAAYHRTRGTPVPDGAIADDVLQRRTHTLLGVGSPPSTPVAP